MNRWTLAGVVVFAVVAGGCRAGGIECGDRFCDSRFETAASCPIDCGGTSCGDRVCEAGENCSTCPGDCGVCTGCGDTLCQGTAGETCSTCPRDCGVCTANCGDGSCRATDGETCSTCVADCGACGSPAEPYQTCGGATTCRVSRDLCTGITNGAAMRSMCTVTGCRSDSDCDNDMFGSLGDCISFAGSTATCFHRCSTSADCYPGFRCYPPPAGGTGAIGNICLPDNGGGPTVQHYRPCSVSADCVDGLLCINYSVPPTGNANLCSSSPCVNDDDCPFDARGGRGACLTFGGGVRACWERCNTRGDCTNTVDFDCTTRVGGATAPVLICVPR